MQDFRVSPEVMMSGRSATALAVATRGRCAAARRTCFWQQESITRHAQAVCAGGADDRTVMTESVCGEPGGVQAGLYALLGRIGSGLSVRVLTPRGRRFIA